MIKITPSLYLDEEELQLSFVRAQGPGGQNVNKVATAVQLRFNVTHSASLPPSVRFRLSVLLGRRLTAQGDLIIKAGRYRTQERNKQDTIARLCELIARAAIPVKKRKRSKPTAASIENRLKRKRLRAKKKLLRQRNIGRDE